MADELKQPRRKLFTYPEYHAWRMARARCHNPKSQAWANYGARGITMCERWRNDFWAFLEDMGERPSDKHEIDRIDNNKGYEPSNCRWVERWQNDRNRRSSRWVEYHGEKRLLIELCEEKQIWPDTIKWRLKSGWSVDEAFDNPTRSKKSLRGSSIPVRKAA